MPQSEPDPLDRIIGANIKRLRVSRGLSQAELGACLPVTYQQIQKYENGVNSVSAADLGRLTVALKCSIEEFFEVQAADSNKHGPGERGLP